MKEYIVTLKEIHRVRVEAETEEAAAQAALHGGFIVDEGWTSPEVIDVQEK